MLPVKAETLDDGALARALEPFIAPLAEAVSTGGVIVAQLLWQSAEMVGLLPFQLHLRWPDRIPDLPLTSTFAILPWTINARHLLDQRCWATGEANETRRAARFARYEQHRSQEDDFVHTDWEEGLDRHPWLINGQSLPATAFISVDIVDGAGCEHRGGRPVLGRYATRQAPRPRVLVPGRAPTEKTWEILATATVGLVDLQALRGPRSRSWAQSFLRARSDRGPTLLVASSPTEVWPLIGLLDRASVRVIGGSPHLSVARVEIVSLDRPLAESELDVSLYPLRDLSAQAEDVINSAMQAWWAAWQSLGDDPAKEGLIQRYLTTLSGFRERDRFVGDQFNAFTTSLLGVASNQVRAMARLNAIRRQLESKGWPKVATPATVLVKHRGAREALISHVRERWSSADYGILDIRTIYEGPELTYPYLVAAGYYGDRALDWMLRSGAEEVALVLDPVEAGYLARTCRRAQNWLRIRCSVSVPILDDLERRLGDVAPAELLRLDLDLPQRGHEPKASGPLVLTIEPDALMLRFTDGESIIVERTRRFDVIDSGIGDVRVVAAAELQPGDEVVVIEKDSQQTYSELLQEVLDRGPSLDLWLERQRWVGRVVAAMRDSSISELHEALAQRGVRVAYATVRAWVRPGEDHQAAVPRHFEHFSILAQLLGLGGDGEALKNTFRAIRLLRIRHQWLGRRLVRLMCAVATGRLDRRSLKRIEESWGVGARELLEGTRIAVIDEVVTA